MSYCPLTLYVRVNMTLYKFDANVRVKQFLSYFVKDLHVCIIRECLKVIDYQEF